MSYAIKNILVPTDFSANANNAMRLAVAIAVRHGAALHLLNIVTAHLSLPSIGAISGAGDELALLIGTAKEHVDNDRAAILKAHELEVTAVAGFGAISTNINAYVITYEIDLVVMGTHGISGWKEFLIGSTAMSVIKESPCPVLTVPVNYLKSTFDKVLYPMRNVERVVVKYNYIKSIVKKNNSDIHLLGVIQNGEIDDHDLINNMKKVIDSILDDMGEVTYEKHFCENIADKILETANSRKDDLMVINATLDTDWKDYFSGSITQQIVNHAMVPVLALKV